MPLDWTFIPSIVLYETARKGQFYWIFYPKCLLLNIFQQNYFIFNNNLYNVVASLPSSLPTLMTYAHL